ncbi:hypothetical protein [Mycoplasma nasistruthionis]|uniref:Uncharacterized protein n=1 Tax=Mycoplasma nasistruthionis TaxID=353852 RepID=A0A4Y6I7N4_9MOLU|nr:hypothetical protein [Mycoplasma nasistruthionis]QCZ36621.1 hypothetical protein FG904_01130 [Mycoplasma nasistruthionis]QDF64918.1 hypothetical protein FIV53_01155 [Mycoplasma nasistruthionis]
MKTADIERVKELAIQYLELKAEAQDYLKLIKQEVKDTEVEFKELLPDGGKVSYTQFQPKNSFDFKGYSNFLHNSILIGKTYDENELEDIMKQFYKQKEPKWKLKISK